MAQNVISYSDPSTPIGNLASSLVEAKLEHLGGQGIKALPLSPLCCSLEESGASGTFHLVKLQTNYDLTKVGQLQVDVDNMQNLFYEGSSGTGALHIAPVVLHPEHGSLKLVFAYVNTENAWWTNWCLSNSRGQVVVFSRSMIGESVEGKQMSEILVARDAFCVSRVSSNDLLAGEPSQDACADSYDTHEIARQQCGSDVGKGSPATRSRRARTRRRIELQRQQVQAESCTHSSQQQGEQDMQDQEEVEEEEEEEDKDAPHSKQPVGKPSRDSAGQLDPLEQPVEQQRRRQQQQQRLCDHISSLGPVSVEVPHGVPVEKYFIGDLAPGEHDPTADGCHIAGLVEVSDAQKANSAPPGLLSVRSRPAQDLVSSAGSGSLQDSDASQRHANTTTATRSVDRSFAKAGNFEPALGSTPSPWPRTWNPWDTPTDAWASSTTRSRHQFVTGAPSRDSPWEAPSIGSAWGSGSLGAQIREDANSPVSPDRSSPSSTAPLAALAGAERVLHSSSEETSTDEERAEMAAGVAVSALHGARPPPRASEFHMSTVTEETQASFGDRDTLFVIHELLGQGGYGSVYRCSLSRSAGPLAVGQEFAVKVISAQRISLLVGAKIDVVVPRLLREAEILHAMGEHPHIVTLHGVFYSQESHKIYLIYEFLRGGDLFKAVVRRRVPFRESEARIIISQIARAVLFGHKRGIAHRDLKMDNCLVEDFDSLSVKVCDYGQAKLIGPNETTHTLTSSAVYTAPDVREAVGSAQPYNAFKADSFAVGVLLYGLLCNALPNAAAGQAYQSHPVWRSLSAGARDLVVGLLVADAGKRLSVEGLLQHPWITDTPPSSGSPQQGLGAEMRSRDGEVSVFLATHQVVVAVQRERGNCLWAATSERFQWHSKYTDERYDEALRLLDAASADGGSCHAAVWSELRTALADARSKTGVVRGHAIKALRSVEPSEISADVIDRVVQSYGSIISRVMRAIAASLSMICGGVNAYSRHSVQLKMLLLTAEQLGCERALLCGYLHQPLTLRDPQVACRVSKVIGARKLLLGSAAASSSETADSPALDSWAIDSGIVAGMSGLFPALDLMDEPLLGAAELAQLESAEDAALSLSSCSAPQLSEWYHLLTQLIDKVHQHVVLNILSTFNPAEARLTNRTAEA
mmetsp:Transcript_147022/g.382128  ORF Transcript_147022/g.382128 Transcript_147022/m.382128 type:complete len:1148 (+) Transcript_147022:67-3510(+)